MLEISAGEYVEFAGGTATGILFEAVDATAAAMSGVALVRDAEYNLSEVVYDAGQNQAAQDAAAVSLTALGLIAR